MAEPEVRDLVRVRRIGHLSLAAAAKTAVNYTAGTTVNSTLDADTPIGILAGHWVAASGSGEAGIASAGARALGLCLFSLNPTAAYHYDPTAASGRFTFGCGPGSHVEVNVYETANAAKRANPLAGADLTYAAGDLIYASANGLSTKEDENSGVPLAIVVRPPSASNASMELRLLV